MAKTDGGKAAAQADVAKGAEGAGEGRDWSTTLFLPQTDFPMRAGLPENEPKLLARWHEMGLYDRLRETSKGRDQFVRIAFSSPPVEHIDLGVRRLAGACAAATPATTP